MANTDDPADPIPKFLVGSRSTNRYSFTWRIGSRLTSFYIKPLHPALQEIKISLHGPDSRHPRPGYKFELDEKASERVQSAGGVLMKQVAFEDKQWFPGFAVRPGVDLVLRLRFPWDFDKSAVSADPPPDPKASDHAVLMPTPVRGYAVDVDIYVCHKKPFWPNEEQARKDNACPIANTARQSLTAVTVHRLILAVSSPRAAVWVTRGAERRFEIPIDDATVGQAGSIAASFQAASKKPSSNRIARR